MPNGGEIIESSQLAIRGADVRCGAPAPRPWDHHGVSTSRDRVRWGHLAAIRARGHRIDAGTGLAATRLRRPRVRPWARCRLPELPGRIWRRCSPRLEGRPQRQAL